MTATEMRIVWADGEVGRWQSADIKNAHAVQEYVRAVNKTQGKGGWRCTAKVEFR